jgi:hypothetical protein
MTRRSSGSRPARNAAERGRDLIASSGRVLTASAIAAGLGAVRPRSSPQRLAWEGERSLALLAGALGRNGRSVATGVELETRTGFLAGAAPADVPPVFAVWRQALVAFAEAVADPAVHVAIAAALDRIESHATRTAERLEPRRIDVLAIGASAGGVAPIPEEIGAFGSDMPLTIVVVLHLGPGAGTLAAQVIGRRADFTVVPAVQGARCTSATRTSRRRDGTSSCPMAGSGSSTARACTSSSPPSTSSSNRSPRRTVGTPLPSC